MLRNTFKGLPHDFYIFILQCMIRNKLCMLLELMFFLIRFCSHKIQLLLKVYYDLNLILYYDCSCYFFKTESYEV